MAWRGQISRNLKELRIILCQSSPSSSSTRSFVEKNYKDLKTLNPKLPILIRECRGVEPQLWARYEMCTIFVIWDTDFSCISTGCKLIHSVKDMGVERGVRLEGKDESQISKALEELVKVGAALKQ
ncbi:NADH dehydrogenase [ubiquinone] 1 alpha subcomplex subunit 2 [Linum perenne]